jgi:4-methyl-5(b-hydroxyethyl)-thiazole monophosphate biosynthesis
MAKNGILVLLAPGFEEIDVCAVTRTLRRSGFSVTVIGLTAGLVRGTYGLSLAPDCTLNEVEKERPRAIVLPGGVQATRKFNADPRVHRFLRRVAGEGGYVMALDTAYTVVRRAGVLEMPETQWNGAPGEETAEPAVFGWGSEVALLDAIDELPAERVLVEGRLVFAQDSAVAKEAALTLAALLGESRHGARRGNPAGCRG